MPEIIQIAPHGGTLIDRTVRGDGLTDARENATRLVQVILSDQNLADLEMIANGGNSPLTGFMGQADFESVVQHMHLENGLPWTLPIILAVDTALAASIKEGDEIALVERASTGNHIVGVMEVTEKYSYDKQVTAEKVFRTTEDKHPGVAQLYQQGEVLLGGPVWALEESERAKSDFPELRYTPAQTRAFFAEKGWRRIVGFQTRNP